MGTVGLSNQGFTGEIMLIAFKKGQELHLIYAHWSFESLKVHLNVIGVYF